MMPYLCLVNDPAMGMSARLTRLRGLFQSSAPTGQNYRQGEGRSDTVYHFLDGERLEPAFKLDAGRYTPPAEAFGTNPPVDWNKYWRVVDIWEGDRTVIVTVQKALKTELYYLVVDLEKPDGGVMAVGMDGKPGLSIDGVPFIPRYIKDNRLVGYMQALDIVDNAKSLTNSELLRLVTKQRAQVAE